MKVELINKIDSEQFIDAVELGDSNSKTLGFLPQAAFENNAKKNMLIGVFEDNSTVLLGYLLYRISYEKVTIVHLCISKEHRNKGVARLLVNYLKQNTKIFKGIRLKCRNNYGINKVWEQFDFIPIEEKPGRSKEGYLLTTWWYPHKRNDLFSQAEDYELKNKYSVVIDMIVFLDLKDNRHYESLGLLSDWLIEDIVLYVTREIYNEINRNKDIDLKSSSRKFVENFHQIPFNVEGYIEILNVLKNKFRPKSRNDVSDLKHIAYAISGGADFFVTRDEFILENTDSFKELGIIVFRPSEFITYYDETVQLTKYKPRKLIGTSLSTNSISSENINKTIKCFLGHHEKRSELNERIRTFLSYPNDYDVLSVAKDDLKLSLIVIDRTHEGKLIIPIFRFLDNKIKYTLIKHMVYKIINIATIENRAIIEVSESSLGEYEQQVLAETKFVKIENSWLKLNIKGVFKVADIFKSLNEINGSNSIISKIKEKNNSLINDTVINYNLERYLFPIKFEDLDIPTFIVPIKSQWAEALFIDRSSEELFADEPDYLLLLNRENVYYRSAKPRVLSSPARILWYVSENRGYNEKGQIKACSYVDEVFVGSPKSVFKRFEDLGIYKWNDIDKTAGKNKEIMAFVFSDTELFEKPVSLNYLKGLFIQSENKKFMVVTPIKIKSETYINIYKRGRNI